MATRVWMRPCTYPFFSKFVISNWWARVGGKRYLPMIRQVKSTLMCMLCIRLSAHLCEFCACACACAVDIGGNQARSAQLLWQQGSEWGGDERVLINLSSFSEFLKEATNESAQCNNCWWYNRWSDRKTECTDVIRNYLWIGCHGNEHQSLGSIQYQHTCAENRMWEAVPWQAPVWACMVRGNSSCWSNSCHGNRRVIVVL